MILRKMRSGVLSALFLGLLVLGGVSLIFTDWNGMFRSGFGKTDLAIVDGTPIKITEFNGRLSQFLRQQNIAPDSAYKMGVVDKVLTSAVFELLLKKNAADLGIRIEDRIVADQVKDLIAPLKQKDTTDKEALKKFLEMQGMNEKQLAGALRDEMTQKILQSTLEGGLYAPNALVEDVLSHQNQTRSVDYLYLPNSAVSITDKPSDEDLQRYYQGIVMRFMQPEKRDVTLAILDTTKVGKATVTDADLQAAYDENPDKYATPESVTVDQIVVSDKKQAEAIALALKTSPSLKNAVQSAKADSKSVQTTSYTKDALPEELAEPVFSAKEGGTVGPLETAFGYNLMIIKKHTPEGVKPFAEVKDAVRKDLLDEKTGDAVYTVTSQIEDRLANGERYEDMKSEFPLTFISTKNLTKTGMSKPKEWDFAGADASKILIKSFAVTEDSPSEFIDVGGQGKLVSVRLDKITPATPKPFADVKESVLKYWTEDNQGQENLLKAQKLADDLNSGKAKPDDYKLTTLKALSNKGDKAIAEDVVPRFMAADKGKFIMAFSKEKSGFYVGRVTSITLGKISEKAKTSERAQLEKDLANGVYMAYLNSLQKQYKVTVNNDLVKRVYGRESRE